MALACCLAAVAADASPRAEATEWFNETYSGFTETSDVRWDDSAGRWTKTDAGDLSTFDSAAEKVVLDTKGRELTFTPRRNGSAKTSDKNAYVKVEAHMKFYPLQCGEEWSAADRAQRAALGLRKRADGSLVFIGWRASRDSSTIKGRWTEISAPGVVPQEAHEYLVTLETDNSCVPTRVRYSIDGTPLADRLGNTWFSTAGGSMDPAQKSSLNKYLSKVTFRGRGEVGSISATMEGAPPARANVSFGDVSRPQAGTELSFSVTPKDGQSVGDALTYAWHRADSTGMRVAALGTDATHEIVSADFGHWLEVDVFDASGYAGTGRFWCSDLPVAYIDVANGAWPSKNKETHDARIRIIGNAEYPDQCDTDMTIHVRGNTTASADKKPYKIKLASKIDLFGLGGGKANKHWVLLANCFDESLMRNKISYDLSGEFGILPMKSEWVDVVMNGDYVGNYLVCQHIRVAKERVNIYDWGDAVESIAEKAQEANPALSADDVSAIEDLLETNCLWMTSGEFEYLGTNYTVKTKGTAGVGDNGVTVVWKKFTTDITGGYIFEVDSKKADDPSYKSFTSKTSLGQIYLCLCLNTPEFGFSNPAVLAYATNYWDTTARAWLSDLGMADGHHYSELADVDSMVGYWLSVYVTANDDSTAFSRYAYKDQGGKLVFGPAWDYDHALGSLQMRSRSDVVYDADGTPHYAEIQPEKWIPGSGTQNYMAQWSADPYFTWLLRRKYLEVRPTLAHVVADGGLMDSYMVKLAASARANDLRWNNRAGFFGDADEEGDVSALKRFLTRRFTWLDGKFATLAGSLTNISQTVTSASLKYSRNAAIAPAFAGSSVNADGEEGMVDVTCPIALGDVTATVPVPVQGAATLAVRVNGGAWASFPVSGGEADISLPAGEFLTGGTNFISFVARNASGAAVGKNAALVVGALPASIDEPDVPPITTGWLKWAWEEIAAAWPEKAGEKPVSYAEYLAFATNSPLTGKTSGGAPFTVAQDYVAGTDPADTNDIFRATISVAADGLPTIGWTPAECPYGQRRYTLWGTPSLGEAWSSVDAEVNDPDFRLTNRFFRVEVSLP
jgi:hypothetical protein